MDFVSEASLRDIAESLFALFIIDLVFEPIFLLIMGVPLELKWFGDTDFGHLCT